MRSWQTVLSGDTPDSSGDEYPEAQGGENEQHRTGSLRVFESTTACSIQGLFRPLNAGALV